MAYDMIAVYAVQITLLIYYTTPECGWIKGFGRLYLQLLPLVLPINT